MPYGSGKTKTRTANPWKVVACTFTETRRPVTCLALARICSAMQICLSSSTSSLTKTGDHISKSQYVELLREFDERIACPATEGVGGMTSIDAEKETLTDHFSSEELRLLKLFCSSSNASDLGSHPSDQEKWMAFLIAVHRNGKNVHCDTFGACLRSERCWPEHGIDRLVSEYDFAMRLLRQNKMAL
ncbi:MAG: hypothetical protein KF705_12695 [Phycisphaeraceae bacterium]|nr:hypothetical protein [Phycisphaeraceae bacterium]